MQSHECPDKKATGGSSTNQSGQNRRATVCTRVPAANQEEKETSVEAQRQACIKQTEKDGAAVDTAYVYQGQGTGADCDRPLLDQLRRGVQSSEVGAVYARSPDRLASDPRHLLALRQEFEAAGADLRFVQDASDDTHDGLEMEDGHSEVCGGERPGSVEQCRPVHSGTAESGPVSTDLGSAVYGYRYHNRRKLRPANEEPHVVRLVFEWAAEGWTDRRIARQLNKMHIRTKRGKRWNRPMVRRILGDRG